MTPLARMILKDLTRPVNKRRGRDHGKILHDLTGAHFFECSALAGLIEGVKYDRRLFKGLFLPAPRTFIEWKCPTPDGCDVATGTLVEEKLPYIRVRPVTHCPQVSPKWVSFPHEARINIVTGLLEGTGDTRTVALFAATLLVAINTPKIIGRRTHDPHRGLARKLIAKQKAIGKFPLRAWTEILLDVTPPPEAMDADGKPIETRLTGLKALHFVRAHLRVRLGRLEFVKAHWRGDGSLGIKRSRYKVVGQPAVG